jgi:glutamyl-tRNA synthetase
MLAKKYGGKLVFRFDDTNPDKEKHHFEKAIVEDLATLGVSWDIGPTYSSDYMSLMFEKAEFLIKKGMAYCDTTPREELQKHRFDGIPTKCRDNSIEENMRLWSEMQKASAEGQTACLRAKISVGQ